MRRIAFARRERYGVFLISGWTRDVARRSRARIKNRTFRLRTIYSKLIVSVACIGFETRDEMMFEGVPACATLIKRSSFLDTRRTSRAEIATAIARTHYAAVTVPRALACALCVASRGSNQRHEQFAPYPGQFAVGLTLIIRRSGS